jgi:hypothetical protein
MNCGAKEHPTGAGVIYPIEELDWNQYRCKKCQPGADHFYQVGTKPKKKVNRDNNRRHPKNHPKKRNSLTLAFQSTGKSTREENENLLDNK